MTYLRGRSSNIPFVIMIGLTEYEPDGPTIGPGEKTLTLV